MKNIEDKPRYFRIREGVEYLYFGHKSGEVYEASEVDEETDSIWLKCGKEEDIFNMIEVEEVFDEK